MRTEALEARAITDPNLYEQKARLAREIATVLRTNIVQGIKTQEAEHGIGPNTWSEFIP